MYEVKDGKRTLKFDGVLLAYSTSYRGGSTRWVEFTLYRTEGGSYVLSRVGMTSVYHLTSCEVAQKNHTPRVPVVSLPEKATPCDLCRPHRAMSAADDTVEVAVETPRYWALVSDAPEGVIDALYKYNEAGVRYLTAVAERLLDEAGAIDKSIERVYKTEQLY